MGARRKVFLSLASLRESQEAAWSREVREGEKLGDRYSPERGGVGACCSPFPRPPSDGALARRRADRSCLEGCGRWRAWGPASLRSSGRR